MDFIRNKRLAGAFVLLTWCLAGGVAETAWAEIKNLRDEPIQPLEKPEMFNPRKVELGKRLFQEPRLSKNGKISCASCHNLSAGGTTNSVGSVAGVSGNTVPLNIPTVIGSGLNFAQFWDGRSDTLEDQIDGPMQHKDEMGSTWLEITAILGTIPEYKDAFQAIYHSPPSRKYIQDAIATFERSLVYTDSPFDRYLRGDAEAIPEDAQGGYQLFKSFGCASCHQGQNIGGNMFQKFGVVEDYFAKRGNLIEQDNGRYNVTKDEADRYYFKVPSLRNVALTAPYFHDGSVATLEGAVDTMAIYQLGRSLSKNEQRMLVAFLKTLTGQEPGSDAQVGHEKK